MLDNKKLRALNKRKYDNPVMQLYTKDSSRSWQLVRVDGKSWLTTIDPSANILLLDYISSKKSEDLVDLDDHLDDVSKNWLNPELFKLLLLASDDVADTMFVDESEFCFHLERELLGSVLAMSLAKGRTIICANNYIDAYPILCRNTNPAGWETKHDTSGKGYRSPKGW
ncbi:ER membrane protein complex subunit 8/9 [Dillenia turbinata]|uniref:ER membrane protein complex subunit 8/9 n=1 Tax=Dillenia turbinata TaxID=194707 RepID=A0AAN8WFQ8_9MAGN